MSADATPGHPVFHGVLPVLETPFTPADDVDFAGFERLAAHLAATPVSGLMFPGFASEFMKLSRDERHELGLLVIAAARDRPGVASVLSVPDHATRIAVEEAEWAVANGADALNLLPPSFLNPSRSEVIAHLAAVLASVPATPVIVQLAPGLTGASFAPDDLAALAARFPNLAAVKVEAVPPGRMVSRFGGLQPRLPCLVGYGGLYLPDALVRGAVGVQPGCSAVEVYHLLWALWTAGDHDGFHGLHRRMAPYLLEWMQHVEFMVQVEKTISVRRGLIASDRCRAPGYRLDAEELAGVDRFLGEFADELALS
ncbi:dihydrodipicolinate synthase family protein [uncultured Amnibacterium sp.]|uniref:dihydrodipicolinate synthase family protein n=1 Tax=uncultured Amnibacterium sp. TaxID=1631851 RepID=UPI0035C9C01C